MAFEEQTLKFLATASRSGRGKELHLGFFIVIASPTRVLTRYALLGACPTFSDRLPGILKYGTVFNNAVGKGRSYNREGGQPIKSHDR